MLRRARDLTGQKFGRLTVLSRADNKGEKVCWNCKCSCGKVTVVKGNHLGSGNTKSCGCYNRERLEATLKDLTGQKFGRLTVTSRAESRGKHAHWNCVCNCGNLTVIRGSNLKCGATTSCGCYRNEQVSDTQSGSSNYNWKGGVTSAQDVIRKSPKYKTWRTAVFKRDNYTCQYSGIIGCKLVAHHIKPFAQILEENSISTPEEALRCKELWDTSNGITLAKEYHDPTSENSKSFHRIYGTRKATEEEYYQWIKASEFYTREEW